MGSGDHGHWLGWYEQELQIQFREFIRPGMTVWDIGANIGFFTLLASRLVTETGRVLAVEPHPSAAAVLREHIRRNELSNVNVETAAVSNQLGVASLAHGATNSMHRLSEDGPVIVSTITLDSMLETGALPQVVKLDIEGAEDLAISESATKILTSVLPIFFIELHPPAGAEACAMLERHNYSLTTVVKSLMRAEPK